MGNALRTLACAFVLAASTAAADDRKNHHILLEPLSCTWATMASLNVPRAGHTATLLADGSVLVVGGMHTTELTQDGTAVLPPDPRTVERYDPSTDTWRFAAPLNRGRRWHAATLLPDGQVLVVGGETSWHYRLLGASAEIYDPVADRWTVTQPNHWNARWQPAVSVLQDGRVLVTGGSDFEGILGPAEIYDRRTDRWTYAAGDFQINRYGHTATTLADGRILFAGGVDDAFFVTSLSRAELYLPSEGRFVLANAAAVRRAHHEATLLADGNVMISGGWASDFPSSPWGGYRLFATTGTTEIFDAGASTWRPGPDLQVPRFGHTVTRLQDGGLLIVGGMRSFGTVPAVTYATLHSTELRAGADMPSFAFAELNDARSHHTATALPNGSVLVVGGSGRDQKPLASVELLGPPAR